MPRLPFILPAVLLFFIACDVANRPVSDPAELFERGVDLFEERSYEQAEVQLRQALEQFEKQGNRGQAARTIGYLGRLKLSRGEYRSAVGLLQSGVEQSRAANDYRIEAQLNRYIGDVFLEMREYAQASQRYQNALSYYSAFNDRKASAEIEMLAAQAHRWAGELELAQALYERAQTYYSSSDDANAKAESMAGVGEVYAAQKRHPEALNSFTQAIAALAGSGDPVLTARLRLLSGLSQSALGNLNAALEQLRDAANVLRSKRIGRELESLILFRIGNTYYANGRYADARRYYAEASSGARAAGDKIAELYNTLFVARCDEALLKPADAQKGAEQLVQLYSTVADQFRACGHRTGEAYAQAQVGRLYGATVSIQRAREFYSKAVEIEESIVGEYLHPELHAPYLQELSIEQEQDRWYNVLAEIQMKEKKPEEALQFLERSSTRQLYNRFFTLNVQIRHPQLKQEMQMTREKLHQIRLLEIEWSRWLSVEPRAIKEEQLQALRLEIGRLKEEVAQSADRIVRMQPNYEPLVRVGGITFTELQNAIPRGTLLLRFLPTPDQLYIFAVARSRFEVRTSSIKREALLNMVHEYQRLLQDPNVYAGVGGVASVPVVTRFSTLSTQLYESLLRPVEGLYLQNLLIIPGLEFEIFPFHALERQDRKGNVQYVVEFMSVDYLPCLSALKFKTAMSTRTKDVVALGNPTGKNWSIDYELRDIRSFYKGVTIWIGLEASWKNLGVARGDLLQISSEYGSGKRFKPLGVLILSGGETQGDIAEVPFEQLSEISVFPIVYLSNQLSEGAGLSAAHALFLRIVGTGDVFLNPWYADRKAAKFFSEFFYTHLANGLAPGDAYRQALLNMIRTKDVNHPRSWGQFFHYGMG